MRALIQLEHRGCAGFTAKRERSHHARVPRLTTDELRLIAQALRYLSNAKITGSMSARNQSTGQDLRRASERALALAERFERATTGTRRVAEK
jgi:hypothetical protein